MGSEDDYHSKNPQVNAWMDAEPDLAEARSSALGKLSAISGADRKPARQRTVLSGLIQRLARAEGSSAEELAARIPADTIRRTKFDVREKVQPDGSILFEDPEGIREGPRALHHK